MPHQRGDQAIQFAARYQHVFAAESADDPLANATALALVLDEVEVGVAPRCFLPDKHRLDVRQLDHIIKQIYQFY
jgi:hypothetical protein